MRFLFLIFVFLIGCSSEKQIQRAKNRLSANPLEAASFCSTSFPNKETIIYRDSVMALDTIVNVSDARYRPMGLAEGPDGSLYISDSKKGKSRLKCSS